LDQAIERVAAAVKRHGGTFKSLQPLFGGACQDNYKVEVVLDGTSQLFALRSDPRTSLPGSLRRNDEYSVVRAAVAAGMRTPAARWFEKDLLRPGADAYFLEWCEGEAIGRRVVRNPELENARGRLAKQLASSLAMLHRVTPATGGDLGLPVPKVSPAESAFEGLQAMLDALPTAHPAVEYAMAWLKERVPERENVVLVHGDFRTGNFMVTPEGLSGSGVLDFEFAHWGSRYEDLAWISVRDWRFGRTELPIGGFAKREDFYKPYAEAIGREMDTERLLFWEIMGNLRWAVGSAAQGERYLTGAEADLELIAIARRSVEMEFEALRLIRKKAL
jgi:aminoglycoside phosphotransferase (APT) family kinase protein